MTQAQKDRLDDKIELILSWVIANVTAVWLVVSLCIR